MNFSVDFSKTSGKINPMHGIGQPPLRGINTAHFHYLKEAGLPYARLHDVGGWFGGNLWVDIHNIFRDFDADETKEESYDFAFTDILLAALIENGCEPYFRLGETIENFSHIKAYRIFPPKDFAKWARICEHIILHYNHGWANGFHYNIQYWEIWNEPDNGPTLETNHLWKGTPEQFFEFYSIVAKHLKSVFGDSIKVGGYGSSGFGYALSIPEKYGLDIEPRQNDTYMSENGQHMLDFCEKFFDYISKNGAPIDFFPWHSYGTTPMEIKYCSMVADKILEKYGFSHIEKHLNEWSVAPTSTFRGTIMAASRCAATMCLMQDSSTSMLCIYDGAITLGNYGALFCPYPEVKPFPLFYSLKAFNELYRLGGHVKPEYDEAGNVFAQAATDGDKKAFLITNISEKEQAIQTNLPADMKAYLIDAEKELDPVEINPSAFTMKADDVILFKNY